MSENPRSKTTFRAHMYKITLPSFSVRSPIHMEPTPFKKGTEPDDPPQDVINFISVHPSAPLPIWMQHAHWIHHVTSFFSWILPGIHLIHKTC